jgi:glycyl-tRNA synthetase beta chain
VQAISWKEKKMSDLMIEIGVEELPSSYMIELNTTLENSFKAFLKEHRWHFEKASLMLTPRRMIFFIQDLSDFQEPLLQEIKGPSLNVALDAQGNPTPALKGFLAKYKADTWDTMSTEQGDYIRVKLSMECLSVIDFFSQQFPKFLQSFPYKKTMRWAKHVFIRPVRWICAFYNEKLIPLELFGLRSEAFTRGLHGENPLKTDNVKHYFEVLKQHEIIYCMKDRVETIRKQIPFDPDTEVLEENANRTETPVVLYAKLPERFLVLPVEIIHTVISSQMKCFPDLHQGSSKRSDGFYFVMNGKKDPLLVGKGFEKVVSARLNDAEYFYEQDMKHPLSQRLEDLKPMVFMEKTGSVFDKIQRLKSTSTELDLYPAYPGLETLLPLLKNDLSTRVVAEFPVLQGSMGEIYALQESFSEEIASAIKEHYYPRHEADILPNTSLGIIAGLLDRSDTITGASVHGIPFSSSADPFGLRRCLNGLIRVYLEQNITLPPEKLFSASWKSYLKENKTIEVSFEQHMQQMSDWFSQRLYLILSQKYPYDLIQTAQSYALENPRRIAQKILLLETARSESQFRELCEAYTRIKNLLKNQEPQHTIQASLFEHVQEQELYHSIHQIDQKLSQISNIQDNLLNILYELNIPVQRFFEKVFVMSENDEVRNNRLGLIFEVYRIIHQYFDLSKVVFEGGTAS